MSSDGGVRRSCAVCGDDLALNGPRCARQACVDARADLDWFALTVYGALTVAATVALCVAVAAQAAR